MVNGGLPDIRYLDGNKLQEIAPTVADEVRMKMRQGFNSFVFDAAARTIKCQGDSVPPSVVALSQETVRELIADVIETKQPEETSSLPESSFNTVHFHYLDAEPNMSDALKEAFETHNDDALDPERIQSGFKRMTDPVVLLSAAENILNNIDAKFGSSDQMAFEAKRYVAQLLIFSLLREYKKGYQGPHFVDRKVIAERITWAMTTKYITPDEIRALKEGDAGQEAWLEDMDKLREKMDPKLNELAGMMPFYLGETVVSSVEIEVMLGEYAQYNKGQQEALAKGNAEKEEVDLLLRAIYQNLLRVLAEYPKNERMLQFKQLLERKYSAHKLPAVFNMDFVQGDEVIKTFGSTEQGKWEAIMSSTSSFETDRNKMRTLLAEAREVRHNSYFKETFLTMRAFLRRKFDQA